MSSESLIWYIGALADGKYMFVPKCYMDKATAYINKHGGGFYTYAGYLVYATNRRWFDYLLGDYDIKYKDIEEGIRPPHIDVQLIKDWVLTETAKQWLNDNIELLKQEGGKKYANLPEQYRR